jgi:hypothetical protein
MDTERRQVLFGLSTSGDAAPATKTIGRTGKIHGEMPAIKPATSATKKSVTSQNL